MRSSVKIALATLLLVSGLTGCVEKWRAHVERVRRKLNYDIASHCSALQYAGVFILLATTLLLSGCSLQSAGSVLQDKAESYLGFSLSEETTLRNRAESYLDFTLPESATIENENDLLPVIPDGYDYFKIEMPTDDELFLQATSNWSALPYTPDEQTFFFGTEDEYAADHYEIGILPNDGYLYYTGEDGHVYRQGKDGFFDSFTKRGEKTVPQDIVNGKYSLTVYDEDENGRYLDFILRVYDSDASILYIFSYVS